MLPEKDNDKHFQGAVEEQIKGLTHSIDGLRDDLQTFIKGLPCQNPDPKINSSVRLSIVESRLASIVNGGGIGGDGRKVLGMVSPATLTTIGRLTGYVIFIVSMAVVTLLQLAQGGKLSEAQRQTETTKQEIALTEQQIRQLREIMAFVVYGDPLPEPTPKPAITSGVK